MTAAQRDGVLSVSDSKLLPCPFCGGSARILQAYDKDGCYWSKVGCDKCGVETRGQWVSSRQNVCPIFFAEVRDQWNARMDPQPGENT